jgi:hypothetical protein
VPSEQRPHPRKGKNIRLNLNLQNLLMCQVLHLAVINLLPKGRKDMKMLQTIKPTSMSSLQMLLLQPWKARFL